MNEITTFHYGAANLDLRTVRRNDDPWFIATDLAVGLEYRDAEQALRLLDADEKALIELDIYKDGTLQKNSVQQTWAISEPGLYKLVARSRKPEAKKFDRWVRHDVLPTIRKTGGYGERSNAGIDREALTTIIKDVMANIVDQLVAAKLMADERHVALGWLSVYDLLNMAGAEQKDRNSLNRRVGHRLRDRIPIDQRRLDRHGAWLFPYDEAMKFMREEGNTMVAEHNAKVRGQGVLPFPPRKKKAE